MKPIHIILLGILAASSSAVFAQTYTGPTESAKSAQHYTGPSSPPVMTVKQLLADGRDDQYVTLVGKIIRHTGGEHYVFSDGSGEINVEIDAKYFPKQVSIDDKVQVQLQGEFDRKHSGKSELDVQQVITIVK